MYRFRTEATPIPTEICSASSMMVKVEVLASQNNKKDYHGSKAKGVLEEESKRGFNSDSEKEEKPKKKKIKTSINLKNLNTKLTLEEQLELERKMEKSKIYRGVDCQGVRIKMKDKCNNAMDFTNRIVSQLTSYILAGNNMKNLFQRRELSRHVTDMNVKEKGSQFNGMASPSLGIVFMPELYLVRKWVFIDHKNQTSSSDLEYEFQDIAFVGCKEVSNRAGYDAFYKTTSSLLYKNVDKQNGTITIGVSEDDEDFKESLTHRKKVAEGLYNFDIRIHKRMHYALNYKFSCVEDVLSFIATGYEEYFIENDKRT